MMTGSQFAAEFGPKGYAAWEAAAIQLARQDNLTPWDWTTLSLADDAGNTATLRVQNDVLSIGPTTDFFRLPLTPTSAQSIWNLFGYLMPTPWIVYQMYRQAKTRLDPISLYPNLGANMPQYLAHSAKIQVAMATAGRTSLADVGLVSGIKKHVVVSNIWQPKKVLIFGWYHPEPNVWTNGLKMEDPKRQPIQPNSNAHGDFYVDYSHGIQAVDPNCLVNGQPMATADLYQHPTLSKLVSNEGPLKFLRYPAVIPPPAKPIGPISAAVNIQPAARIPLWISPNLPSTANQGALNITKG